MTEPDQARANTPHSSFGRITSWALYDFANSAFPLVMTTAVYVLYFKRVVVGGADVGYQDMLWGWSISLSAILVAINAPWLGALADSRRWRRRMLAAATLIAAVATAILSQAGAGMVLFAMIAFIVANAAFEGSSVFYASLLPAVARPDQMGRVSGYGWALGYFGGLFCLVGTMGFALDGRVDLVCLCVAAWYLIFSLPTLLFVPEPAGSTEANEPVFRQLRNTLREIAGKAQLRRFFIGYFIYNDAIITIIAFSGAFAADELGFTQKEVILLVIAVQVTGAIGAATAGFVADRIGNARAIRLTLVIWLAVTAAAFVAALDLPIWQADSQTAQQAEIVRIDEELAALAESEAATTDDSDAERSLAAGAARVALAEHRASVSAVPPPSPKRKSLFGVLGLLLGLSLGATQSCSRSFLASVVPESRSASMFGLYAVAGRFSAVIGPTLFGVISWATGSKAWSVLFLASMFALGLWLMGPIRDDEVRSELAE